MIGAVSPEGGAVLGDTILCITEDVGLLRLLSDALGEHNLSLLHDSNIERGLAACTDGRCALVLVDAAAHGVTLPLLVLEVRRRAPVPVIVLAVDADPAHAACLLDSGADDCVGRPVHRENLVARIRAALRRSRRPHAENAPIWVGDLRVDQATRSVSVNGEVIGCTPTEYEILEFLARRAGRVVPRDQLLAVACGRDASPLDRAVDVHISHLRRKLQPHGQRIVTMRGVGYLLSRIVAT